MKNWWSFSTLLFKKKFLTCREVERIAQWKPIYPLPKFTDKCFIYLHSFQKYIYTLHFLSYLFVFIYLLILLNHLKVSCRFHYTLCQNMSASISWGSETPSQQRSWPRALSSQNSGRATPRAPRKKGQKVNRPQNVISVVINLNVPSSYSPLGEEAQLCSSFPSFPNTRNVLRHGNMPSSDHLNCTTMRQLRKHLI